MAYCS